MQFTLYLGANTPLLQRSKIKQRKQFQVGEAVPVEIYYFTVTACALYGRKQAFSVIEVYLPCKKGLFTLVQPMP